MSVLTTSSVPAVTDAVLDVLTEALDVKVFEAYPGSNALNELVFLGGVEWDGYDIATIKAGRKARQEDYRLEFAIWVVWDMGTSPGVPKASRDRAFEVFGQIEDAFAEDPSMGEGYESVQWSIPVPTEAGAIAFERGHAYQVKGEIEVHARLQ